MSHDARKYLYDVCDAASKIERFTADKSLDDYHADDLLRSAVERQFEIIGEALNRMSRHDLAVCEKIRGYRRAIAFRNILIHGYAAVDDEVVWRVVSDSLPALASDARRLLNSVGE